MTAWVQKAADALATALTTGQRIPQLPADCRPVTQAQAYAIQQAFVERTGRIGGWKVGGAETAPYYAPMPSRLIAESPTELAFSSLSAAALEVEVAFRMQDTLPPRAQPYSRDEILAAVASVHASIEVIDSRYETAGGVDALSRLADLQNNALFVVGDGAADWSADSLPALSASLEIDGRVVAASEESKPPADPCALLVWLTGALSQQGFSLEAGTLVTCGSYTGKTPISAPLDATARVQALGSAELRIT